ncbi:MAG: hypothetical protein FJ150_05120 [Euryarchaeota archaeon]|nr:hypothetical protein [Euryarchaeota archaeon]
MKSPGIKEWIIICKNRECKHRYDIPENWPVEWKIRKSYRLCSTKYDTSYPELKEPVQCPLCGSENIRVTKILYFNR